MANGTFKTKDGLVIDFNPTAKLEVEIRQNCWVETSPYMFRSWGGNRRINGKPFQGAVCFLGSNALAETQKQTINA